MPVLRPRSRRSQNRFTLLLIGALALLILIRVVGAHPLPKPSHLSPAAAVAGYLTGLEHRDLGEVRGYLAPAQRPQASSLLKGFARQRASIAAPALTEITQTHSRATVTISLQVCYQPPGGKPYTCEPVGHAPLGLPDQITCVELDGSWYATTLFKPN